MRMSQEITFSEEKKKSNFDIKPDDKLQPTYLTLDDFSQIDFGR